ncbi:MAG: antibiotic biosynthesis monooxygenase [Pirellulales bacterium]|nr:antibiotic biosynthesis monooxygenase [Pirellulales bacterium]
MIHVIATLHLQSGCRQEFLAEFKQLVPEVRAEAGCLEYAPAVDLSTSIPGLPAERSDAITVVEKWESVESLAAHLNAPHMLRYRERVKDMLVSADIRVLQPA